MRRLVLWLLAILFCGLLSGCATTYVEEKKPVRPTPDLASFPAYDGPKTVVAVLPLGLSARAAKAYPHLLAKDVGLGIHNRVIETLYDTNRFRFVEEKPEVVKDVLDRQWLSMAGMVDQGTAVEMGKLLGAQKVIYGEVYDFAQGGEQVAGFSSRKDFNTRMGVQVRCVDVETLEYVPGSGTGRGGDVGEASEGAIREAVAGLIRRLK
ncbi:CsgG/HfaB family protein [Trichloromonas sp.]|uniref:CsgG/HfaB family protein n=1 Tax=Trichloromonas sp. TaxID=3069249 RepID=UPI002A49F5B9|nr:CsgG/HfaB family protein [Trichloromonas sp.]